MDIKLYIPLCISNIGKRDANQDSIYPELSESVDRTADLFMVCDGVGGYANGEVASKIVCNTLSSFHSESPLDCKENINTAIVRSEVEIDDFTRSDPESVGMATTLALLCVHSNGVTVAHIGDSRVYHIRAGNILFKTEDHSFVNELVQQNIISEKDAIDHPKKNIITKAISGHNSHKNAEVICISDVRKDDYFFLCTDGVVESLSDQQLLEIMGDYNKTNREKMQEIDDICLGNSKDNFSAYLIQIESVLDRQ